MTNKEEVVKILSILDSEKACRLDEIPCRMLKDDVVILKEPISQTVANSKFLIDGKITKVRPTFKKGEKYRTKQLQTCFTSACNV